MVTAMTGLVAQVWTAGIVDTVVFVIGAVIVLGGALGVVWSRNPVHSALSLVTTLFGVAVLFISQQAHFLAVVQVIVYAGAIVVLFVFVIMLLGVDAHEAVSPDPVKGHGTMVMVVLLLLAGELALLTQFAFNGATPEETGVDKATQRVIEGVPDIEQLATAIFTRHVLAFEITSVLLLIAVVGAVVLARRPRMSPASVVADELGEADADPEALEVR